MDLLNKQVKHITLGVGTIVAQDDKYITVEFASKTSRFQYPAPDTFVKFLRAEDESIQVAILQEIAEQKRLARVFLRAAIRSNPYLNDIDYVHKLITEGEE